MAGAVKEVCHVMYAHMALGTNAGGRLADSELKVLKLGTKARAQLRKNTSCGPRKGLFRSAYLRWRRAEDSVCVKIRNCRFHHIGVDGLDGGPVVAWRHFPVVIQVWPDLIYDFGPQRVLQLPAAARAGDVGV